eukprot:COSAG05_NODE_19425_length_293_cov_0.510309_1_plen_62_part_10
MIPFEGNCIVQNKICSCSGVLQKRLETSIKPITCAYFIDFFKQKTAYGMESRDWSSDVCSSD